MVALKILWEQQRHYLALAVKDPCAPMPYFWHYPGGTVLTRQIIALKKMTLLNEARSSSPDDVPLEVLFS
jgi:hypothetical protein